MKKNPYLESVEKILKKQKYHVKFRDDNLLEVSLDKSDKVFCFLTIEKDNFPGIVVSLALDFHQIYPVAGIVIDCMHVAPVALGEPFYRSRNGNLYWGDDASRYFELEYNEELIKQLEPINDSLH